jgi:hypothetical protein
MISFAGRLGGGIITEISIRTLIGTPYCPCRGIVLRSAINGSITSPRVTELLAVSGWWAIIASEL